MNKKRLLKLADLLEADAKNKKGIKFDLGMIGESSDWMAETFEPKVDCGTTACAMGLAAISGAFKGAGLSYKVTGNAIDTTMNGRRTSYIRSACRVFEITYREANYLFSPYWYFKSIPRGSAGEIKVAKLIRDFVAGKVAFP